jgi:hypothetical protein
VLIESLHLFIILPSVTTISTQTLKKDVLVHVGGLEKLISVFTSTDLHAYHIIPPSHKVPRFFSTPALSHPSAP